MNGAFERCDELTQEAITNAVRNGSTDKLYRELAPYLTREECYLLLAAIDEVKYLKRETDNSIFFDNECPEYPDNRSQDEKLRDYYELGYMLTGCEHISPAAARAYGIRYC